MDARSQRQARRDEVARITADREARGRNKKSTSRIRKMRRKVGAVLIEAIAPLILRAIARTWRVTRVGDAGQELLHSDGPFICAMWHGRMLTLMPIKHHCRRGVHVLVSPSDDGGLAKRALDKFGYRVVRGSLSRRGARAMREMHEAVQQGAQLVITPDGPRGPRHSINTGPAWLARATGAPILTCGVAMSRAWRFKSWDRMTIPKPFARVEICYGEPVFVDKDATDEELEIISAAVRDQLMRAERAAFGRLGVECDLEDESAPRNERDPDTSAEASGS